jgi:hypothetical protein
VIAVITLCLVRRRLALRLLLLRLVKVVVLVFPLQILAKGMQLQGHYSHIQLLWDLLTSLLRLLVLVDLPLMPPPRVFTRPRTHRRLQRRHRRRLLHLHLHLRQPRLLPLHLHLHQQLLHLVVAVVLALWLLGSPKAISRRSASHRDDPLLLRVVPMLQRL